VRRTALGLSQREAAAAIGVQGPAFCGWENGQIDPAPAHWPRIISWLECDPICPAPTNPAEKIAFVQRHRGLTLTEMARLLKTDRHTLSALLTPGRKPRGDLLARIDRLMPNVSG